MKKDRTDEDIVRSWLRKPPSSQKDLRVQHDSYWRLRALGYAHSYAKLALRGQEPRVTYVKAPDPEEIAKEYGIRPEEIFFTDPVIARVEIDVRPESLTEEVVAKAGPLGNEYSIADKGVPGLVLRIRSSGHKSYVLYYRVRGFKKTQKIRIATAGAVTLKMAREMAREHFTVANMGKDPTVWSFNGAKFEMRVSTKLARKPRFAQFPPCHPGTSGTGPNNSEERLRAMDDTYEGLPSKDKEEASIEADPADRRGRGRLF
jgi:hypothetical protein